MKNLRTVIPNIHCYAWLIILGVLFFGCDSEGNKSTEEIKIRTSKDKLSQGFIWAKGKAKSFVQTGNYGPINISERNAKSTKKVAYIPSYWAGYPGRSAFYSRDFCHQAIGAHLLGLNEENFEMLKAFAASADVEKKWFPLWAINFDGSPFLLDYKGDDDFVREVPAVFELVQTAYKLYRWTGDKRYIENEVLWKYYTKAVTDFISLHDKKIPNGVAEGTGKGIFEGAASYNELPEVPLIESGDAIASQYKAFWAYAKMAEYRGEKQLAKRFARKAENLKVYFNKDWGIKNNINGYNRGYLLNKEPVAGWGKENSWFLPMKGIVEYGSVRTDNYLAFINDRLEFKSDRPENIEALSYIPEVFFSHHQNEIGWKWMKYILSNIEQPHISGDLTGRNGDYPEVSFVLIKNVVEGLMGIYPNAADKTVTTLSHLPDEIQYLGVDNINIGNVYISVTHEAGHTTRLKFLKGKGTLVWKAGFPGSYDNLFVNGIKKQSSQGIDNGLKYSYYVLELEKGDEFVVSLKP